MLRSQKSLGFWEVGGRRRALAISAAISLLYLFLAHFSELSHLYEKQTTFRNLLDLIAASLTLTVAGLELRHSREANEHRARQVELSEEANEYRAKNSELQGKVHALQQSIEERLTKIRLYPRARWNKDAVEFMVSNLSGFDLWIDKIEVVVTESGTTKPQTRLFAGATQLSSGRSESGYLLYGALMKINGDQANRMDMKFHVEIQVTGLAEGIETIRSPYYHLKIMPGQPASLETLRYK